MTKTAIDTNILVRLLVEGESAQSRIARNLLSAQQLFVSVTVLLETEWVLRSIVKAPKARVNDLFQSMLNAESLTVEDPELVSSALAYHAVGLDFADALHVCRLQAGDRFLTFDRALVKRAQKHIEHVSVTLAS